MSNIIGALSFILGIINLIWVIWVTLSIRDLEDRIETIEVARNLEYERRQKD